MGEERSGLHFEIALKCVDKIYPSLSILGVVEDAMSPVQQELASHLVAARPRVFLDALWTLRACKMNQCSSR